MVETDPRVFVGIDWGSEAHHVCAVDPSGAVLGERVFRHNGKGLGELCEWLQGLVGSSPEDAWVAIEVPQGAVVETLLERGFVVHAINPKQLDRFRDRFTVAGAKDDSLDARVLADSLRTDRRSFRRLVVDAASIIELREWSRMREELQQEHVRLTNRHRQQLQRYFPAFLELMEDVGAGWALDLWEMFPTPEAAMRGRPKEVDALLASARIRRFDGRKVLGVLGQKPVTVAAGTQEAAVAHIRLLMARIRLVNEQIRECQRRLKALCDRLTREADSGQGGEQRDVAIIGSMPGIGLIVLAALLAEAWQPLKARDYHALRALSGVAPVTQRSGKQGPRRRWKVLMRQACHYRLRNALYHWARVAAQRDPSSKAAYKALRERGCSHGRALRSLGDRLLRVLCAMLRDGTPYDPHRRQAKAA